jgi:uncharacterized protein (TIGR03437 family)
MSRAFSTRCIAYTVMGSALFVFASKGYSQLGIGDFAVTASSSQMPPPMETGFTVPFRYQGVDLGVGNVNFLLVTPSSGQAGTRVAIGLNPQIVPFLPPGGYSVFVRFALESTTRPTAGDFVNLRVLQPPAPVVSSVVNSATLRPVISPGSLVSIFGSNIGTPPLNGGFNDAGIYPSTLGHSKVTFNGIAAPLLYVSNNQINAVVPFEVAGQGSVDVVVMHHQQSSSAQRLTLGDTSPGIFTVTQAGRGQGAILNADNSPNSVANPVSRGSFIQIFGTGGGRWAPDLPSGSIYTGTALPRPRAPVSARIGGQSAQVLYAGVAPYLVGVLQVNVRIPDGLSPGSHPIELTVGDANNAAQEVTVAVQ